MVFASRLTAVSCGGFWTDAQAILRIAIAVGMLKMLGHAAVDTLLVVLEALLPNRVVFHRFDDPGPAAVRMIASRFGRTIRPHMPALRALSVVAVLLEVALVDPHLP